MFTTFLLSHTYGQRSWNIPKNNKGDTIALFNDRKALAEKIGLNSLLNNADAVHLRIWVIGQAIDIWSADNIHFNGLITNYSKPLDADKVKDAFWAIPVYTNNKVIAPDRAEAIYKLFVSNKICGLPADVQIPKWAIGDKGINFVFEYSTPENYSFKTYWTPGAQLSLPEARQIASFIDTCTMALSLNEIYSSLTSTLPEGKYINDGYGVLVVSKNPIRKHYIKESK